MKKLLFFGLVASVLIALGAVPWEIWTVVKGHQHGSDCLAIAVAHNQSKGFRKHALDYFHFLTHLIPKEQCQVEVNSSKYLRHTKSLQWRRGLVQMRIQILLPDETFRTGDYPDYHSIADAW